MKVIHYKNRGFTLIELLIVFSIISIISAVSIASFVNYSRSQQLSVATDDVASLMKTAKLRAQSQVKPDSCGSSTLNGYEVRVCGLTGSLCSTADTYELHVRCGGTSSIISSKRLPTQVSFVNSGTTSTTFFFQILTNAVVGAGTVALQGFGSTKSLTLSQQGSLTIQ